MTQQIPLYRGKGRHARVVAHAIVDVEDAQRLLAYRWNLSRQGRGYAVRYRPVPGSHHQPVGMHNDILGQKWVDHRDGDPLNNTRANLRPATHAQNMQNRRKHRNGTTSPERGVHWLKRDGKWRAQVKVNGRHVWAKRFSRLDDAVTAVRQARHRLLDYATN